MVYPLFKNEGRCILSGGIYMSEWRANPDQKGGILSQQGLPAYLFTLKSLKSTSWAVTSSFVGFRQAKINSALARLAGHIEGFFAM